MERGPEGAGEGAHVMSPKRAGRVSAGRVARNYVRKRFSTAYSVLLVEGVVQVYARPESPLPIGVGATALEAWRAARDHVRAMRLAEALTT